MKPPICRRCGKPRDESHVPAPFLCAWEPDRDKVRAALVRDRLRVVTGGE